MNNTFSDEIIQKTWIIIEKSLKYWFENIEKLEIAEIITIDDMENGWFDCELVQKGKENTVWFRVYGVIDFAYKDFNEKYHVVDWKTGSNNGEESTRIQLLIYALWMNIKHKISIEDMVFDVWYLDKKEIISYTYTEDDFVEHFSYILEIVENMFIKNSMPEQTFSYVSDDNLNACKICKFQHICEFSNKGLNA